MIKYVVDGEMEFISVSECAEYIVENGIGETEYDEMLDECYEMVNICGYEYHPSYALKNLDSIVYNCGLNDYRSSQQSDIEYELNRMDDGDSDTWYGYEVEVIERYPSFKIKCIKNEEEDVYFTVGKVYEVVNGILIDNDNNISLPYTCDIEDLEDINRINDGYEFELVEE